MSNTKYTSTESTIACINLSQLKLRYDEASCQVWDPVLRLWYISRLRLTYLHCRKKSRANSNRAIMRVDTKHARGNSFSIYPIIPSPDFRASPVVDFVQVAEHLVWEPRKQIDVSSVWQSLHCQRSDRTVDRI